ncbi:hypothetical protein C8Q79DRAFT_287607 [Trametes meyenii]|nr:hypothetical protein C8Q79DRAFT_287607 [Trametes meyenii]
MQLLSPQSFTSAYVAGLLIYAVYAANQMAREKNWVALACALLHSSTRVSYPDFLQLRCPHDHKSSCHFLIATSTTGADRMASQVSKNRSCPCSAAALPPPPTYAMSSMGGAEIPGCINTGRS